MDKRVKKTTCYIESCPVEIKLKISETLCSKDLAKLECVNSAWRQLLNNNESCWKNKCFSDNLWLKTWKNMVYYRCMQAKINHNRQMCTHENYYEKKVWDEMCYKVQKDADSLNLVEKLPEWYNWKWKFLYNLWLLVEKNGNTYIDCLVDSEVNPLRDHLNSTNLFKNVHKQSEVLAWTNHSQYLFLDVPFQDPGAAFWVSEIEFEF